LRDFADSDDQRLLAQAHLLAEWCCSCLGLAERVDHERAALALLTELDDSIGLANLLLNRGVSAWRECRAADAIADVRASSELYERAGDVPGVAIADNNLAETLTSQFRLDEAELLLLRVRRLLRAANYPLGAIAATSGLSRIAAWRGQVTEALELQIEALTGFRELGADDYVVDSLVRLVEIHVIAGDARAALEAAKDAERALARLGDVPVTPAALARLTARALLLAGRDDDARDSFQKAFELAMADGFTYEIALASMGLARMDGDDERYAAGLAQLAELGVIAAPPGT
jgi:tetratricopeptide (TPR) repeat protein